MRGGCAARGSLCAVARRATPTVILDDSLQRVLDLLGIAAFATSGAVLGEDRDFDVVGMVVLALLAALAGGIIRDGLLGELPPQALRDAGYLVTPVVVAVVVAVASPLVRRAAPLIDRADAVGLGLFSVAGTAKAMTAGVGPVPAVALGLVTAIGGGVLRDVAAGRTPVVFGRDSELYGLAALPGALLVVAAFEIGAYGPAAALVAVLATIGVRLAAVRWHWRAPVPRAARRR